MKVSDTGVGLENMTKCSAKSGQCSRKRCGGEKCATRGIHALIPSRYQGTTNDRRAELNIPNPKGEGSCNIDPGSYLLRNIRRNSINAESRAKNVAGSHMCR